MKRVLALLKAELYHYSDGKKVAGPHADLSGDVSDLRGDVSDLSGDVSGLRGDVSGLSGYVSDLRGDVDAAEITDEERANGVDVADLVVAEDK